MNLICLCPKSPAVVPPGRQRSDEDKGSEYRCETTENCQDHDTFSRLDHDWKREYCCVEAKNGNFDKVDGDEPNDCQNELVLEGCQLRSKKRTVW